MKVKKILFFIFAISFVQIKPAEQKVEPSKWAKILESQEFKNTKTIVLDFFKKTADYLETRFHFNNALPKNEQPNALTIKIIEKIKTLTERVPYFILWDDELLTQKESFNKQETLGIASIIVKRVVFNQKLFDLVNPNAIEVKETAWSKIGNFFRITEIVESTDSKTTIFSEMIGWFKQRPEMVLLFASMIAPTIYLTHRIYLAYQDYKEYKKAKEVRKNYEEI